MAAKIFHIKDEDYTYTVVAESEAQAKEHHLYENGVEEDDIKSITEIPESDWDNHHVTIWPENNKKKKPFKLTYQEEVSQVALPYTMASTNPEFQEY